MEYTYQNEKPKESCKFCKDKLGETVVTTTEATAAPFHECTSKGGCKCFVALDVES